eukprot:2904432-Pyramimonas_sp.AAC.1
MRASNNPCIHRLEVRYKGDRSDSDCLFAFELARRQASEWGEQRSGEEAAQHTPAATALVRPFPWGPLLPANP